MEIEVNCTDEDRDFRGQTRICLDWYILLVHFIYAEIGIYLNIKSLVETKKEGLSLSPSANFPNCAKERHRAQSRIVACHRTTAQTNDYRIVLLARKPMIPIMIQTSGRRIIAPTVRIL